MKPEKCDSCERAVESGYKGHANDAAPLHECPYQSEINDKTVMCNCCRDCTQECMDDI